MPSLTNSLQETLASVLASESRESFNLDETTRFARVGIACLVGASEDGLHTHAHAERTIAARHLLRAVCLASRLGEPKAVTSDADAEEECLLAFGGCKEIPSKIQRRKRKTWRKSEDDAVKNEPKSASSLESEASYLLPDGGNPLQVNFASLDLPSDLLDTMNISGNPGDTSVFLYEDEFGWMSPLSLRLARRLLTNFSRVSTSLLGEPGGTGGTDDLPPLWIACDDSDVNSDAFMSSYNTKKGTTNIVTVSTQNLSPIHARDLITNHLGAENPAHGLKGLIQVSAKYFLRMTTSQVHDDVHNFTRDSVDDKPQPTGGRQMVLEVNWVWEHVREKQLMQAPVVTDKQVSSLLHLTIGGSPGAVGPKLDDQHQTILTLFEDMKKVETFLRSLTLGGELRWFAPECEGSVGDTTMSISPTGNILHQVKSVMRKTASNVGPTATEEDASRDSGARKLDFVGELWNVLKFCTSSRELQEGLNQAILAIMNTRSAADLPRAHSASKSHLAQLVIVTEKRLLEADGTGGGFDQSPASRQHDNPLFGLNPLLLLAELGIDKLTQDYRAFGLRLLPQLPLDKLASGASLFRGGKASRTILDAKDKCLTDFHHLVILHYMVDSLTQIKTFFPTASLEDCALKTASILRSSPPKNMGDFKTVSLPMSLAEDVKVEHLRSPTSWLMATATPPEAAHGVTGPSTLLTLHVSPHNVIPFHVGAEVEVDNQNNFYLTSVISETHCL